MKGKSKSSKRKLGLATALFLCSLSFLAGFFISTFFSQDVSIIKPRLRKLEVVHVEGEKYRDSIPNGETGESSVESIPFQVLSWKPLAYYFPNFATAEQCERIIEMAKLNLKPSTLALRNGETEESSKGTRTNSSGAFISASEDETGTLDFIEKKIAMATSILVVLFVEKYVINIAINPYTANSLRAFNILRYEIGQKYDSHYDAFNPSEYGPQSSQRVASFLLYLSDVQEGGETMFPFENGMSVKGYDYRQCVGLKIKPRRGDGLLFYSLFLNGTIDPTSLHGSCPLIKGEKWVATKWIRDQEQFD